VGEKPGGAQVIGRSSLEGERRLVSVLFADVSGFTALSSQLDPEDVTALMNECFELLSARIRKHGGTIDKYIGDAIMALFGAPISHENDPERAVRAAIEMQEALQRFSQRLVRRVGLPLRMRIGINTGYVVAGAVGSSAKMDYTVMGDAVNVASRLEHHAAVDTILVSQSTYEATAHAVEYRALAPLQVKGKDEPLAVYEVVGLRRARGRVRGIAGLEMRLVGRDDELAALVAAAERAAAGQPQLVGITGEAGLGKSRMLYELRRALEARGLLDRFVALKGRSLPYDEANAYGPVLEMLRACFGIDDADAVEDVQAKVAEGAPDPAQAPYLLRLLVPSYQDERLRYLSAEQLQRETHAALLALIVARARQQPHILIFEDTHWIDSSSLAVLNALWERLVDEPVLILCPFRPDFQVPASWPGRPGFRRLDLQPLTPEQSRELIDGLLQRTDLPDDVKALMVEKSGGNPYYVEELIKALIDAKIIVHDADGVWRMTRQITDVDVPGGVQRVILARIDRLGEEAKRVLQQAAVIGRRFPRLLLEATSDAADIAQGLRELEERELIFPIDLAGGGEYSFKHVLTQEVAYQTLLVRRRRELHARVARGIETLYRQSIEQRLDALVYHCVQGELWPDALVYAQRAADRAKALFANKEALRYYDQALALVERLESAWQRYDEAPAEERGEPPAPDRATLAGMRLALLLNRGAVHGLLANYDAALRDYGEVVAAAPEPRMAAQALWSTGEVQEKQGRYDQALASYQRALELLDDADQATQPLRAKVLASLGFVYQRRGQGERARACGLQSLALVEGSDHLAELGQAYNLLGFVAYSASDWAQAIAYWQQAAALYERVGDTWQASRVYNNLAVAHFYKGEVRLATEYFRKNLEAMQKIGDVLILASSHLNLGNVYLAQGDSERAIEHYARALEMQERAGQLGGQVRCHISLGELQRERGDLAASLRHLETALRLATEIGATESLPQAYRQRAETKLRLDRAREALADGERALAAARETGKRLEEALALRALGRAHRLLKQPAEAENALGAAVTLLNELQMPRELGITLSDLAGLFAATNRLAEAGETVARAIAVLEGAGAEQDLARAVALRAQITARLAEAAPS
jgi:class 3 adenylate cyclase/predicted ATPase